MTLPQRNDSMVQKPHRKKFFCKCMDQTKNFVLFTNFAVMMKLFLKHIWMAKIFCKIYETFDQIKRILQTWNMTNVEKS